MADDPAVQPGCWRLTDPNRHYVDPVPVVYANLITPNVCISARVFDIANRRWYELNVAKDIRDEDWITATVSSHIKLACEPFNVITVHDDGRATLSTRDPRTVGIQVPRTLKCCLTSVFPTTSTDEILEKQFLAGSVDSCTWNGRKCVYKHILFEEDVVCVQREISVRTQLIERAGWVSSPESQMSMVGISPILAVVIDSQTLVIEGLILPYGGLSLDHFANNLVDENSTPTLRVTLRHLSAVLRAVSYLSESSVMHGDICARNVCIKDDDGTVAASESIMLVDLGDIAPQYKGDAHATGELLLWCAENLGGWSENEREIIKGSGKLLVDGGELSSAIEKLGG
jgi:hypothetical protein